MLLIVGGEFKDEELKELSQLLRDHNIEVKIGKYKAFHLETKEIVKFIFQGFSSFAFIRDGILFDTLKYSIKKAFTWVRNKKGSKTKIQAGAMISFKNKEYPVTVNFGIPEESVDLFFEKTKKVVTVKFLKGIQQKEIVSITWDDKKQEVRILRF